MNFIPKNLLFLFIAIASSVSSQDIIKDTSYFPESNKIMKIEAKRNGVLHGVSKYYLSYTKEPKLKETIPFLEGKKCGLIRWLDYKDRVANITNIKSDSIYFEEGYFKSGFRSFNRIYHNDESCLTYYNDSGFIKRTNYGFQEYYEYYPNKHLKKVLLKAQKPSFDHSFNYYEFYIDGSIRLECQCADTFYIENDTIITFDEETFQEIVQVVTNYIPLKNGYCLRYSQQGILEEKKYFKFNQEKK